MAVPLALGFLANKGSKTSDEEGAHSKNGELRSPPHQANPEGLPERSNCGLHERLQEETTLLRRLRRRPPRSRTSATGLPL